MYFVNDYSRSKTVSDIINDVKEENKYSSENEIKQKAHEILKKHLVFTDYKYNLYNYLHIFFLEDSSNEFFKRSILLIKSAAEVVLERFEENEIPRREVDELINVIKVRYFKSSDIPIIEKKKIDYILLESETNCDSIIHYRKLNEKFNINIKYKECPFIMVLPVNSIVNENYSYNSQFRLTHANHSFKKNKVKYKTDSSIYPILPIERARIYFFNKKQWKFASKLPSILVQFERSILIHQMISKLNLFKRVLNENELRHFTAAVSSPAMMEDYSYEILETLGDSILKFMITFHFFDKFVDYSEGDISKKRNEITKNNYLYEKGKNSCLVNYIYTSPYNMKNWDPPLKFKHVQKFEFTITKKTMADVVEAVLGACFLSNDMFDPCVVYLKYIDVLNGNNDFTSNFLSKLHNFSSSSLLNLSFLNIAFEADISFIELYNCFAIYNEEFEPEIILNTKELSQIGHNLLDIDFNDPVKIQRVLSNIEDKCLNYKFKDKSLLKSAFTHKSADNSKSYERLEILGDSIVEAYIMSTIFHLSDRKINIDDSFNPGNLSKLKAFLSSNYFLLRLSVFFKLHENMIISTKSMKKMIDEANKYIIGINFHQKLNEYEESNIGRPKIVSDIFESLVGAVFVDSDLNECFKMLNIMLGPFVVYCAKYLGKLKYSPIAEFVELCQDKYKAGPVFTAKKKEQNEIYIEASIDNKVISKGVGFTEDSAKQAACINGLKKIK